MPATTTMANGTSPPSVDNSAGGMQFKFLAHVQSLPLVTDSLDQIYSYPIGRNAGETIKAAGLTAFKFSGPINPLLKKADSLADSGLSNIESRFPLVKAPTSEIKEKTSGAAKTTVDTYVGVFQDKFGNTAQQAKVNGQEATEDVQVQMNGAKHSLQDSIDPILKPVLDKVEDLLDTYLPKAQAKIDDAKSQAGDAADEAAAKVPTSKEAKQEAEAQAKRVVDITFSMFDRSTNAAKTTVHAGFQRVADVTASASEYVQWSVQNPSKVPEAALHSVQASSATIRERVDGTVEITRKNANTLSDLASQARGTAMEVFETEKKSAPKDQPRGIVITAINTALVLTGKSLDQAKHYFQDSNLSDETKHTVSQTTGRIAELADDTVEELGSVIPDDVEHAAHNAEEHADQTVKQASKSIEDILHEEHINK